jgi:hypothetical protein
MALNLSGTGYCPTVESVTAQKPSVLSDLLTRIVRN